MNVNRKYRGPAYNNLKKKFKETIRHNLDGVIMPGKIGIEYVIYKKNKRLKDRMNVCALVDKFFCDCLTECGVISDDNDDIIEYQFFRTGGIDKDNPRIEITVHDLSVPATASSISRLFELA